MLIRQQEGAAAWGFLTMTAKGEGQSPDPTNSSFAGGRKGGGKVIQPIRAWESTRWWWSRNKKRMVHRTCSRKTRGGRVKCICPSQLISPNEAAGWLLKADKKSWRQIHVVPFYPLAVSQQSTSSAFRPVLVLDMSYGSQICSSWLKAIF